MLTALQAQSNIRGFSVDLEWTWIGSGDRPALVLLRRTRAHPQYAGGPIRQEELEDDGLVVLDLEQTFGGSGDSWALIRRELYLGRNAAVEGNLQLAEFSQYFRTAGPPAGDAVPLPMRIVIGYYDAASKIYSTLELTGITTVNATESHSADWARLQHWEIYHAPGGGPTIRAGEVVVSSGHRDGVTADRFTWQPEASAPVTVTFDHQARHHTEVVLAEGINPDSGDWKRRVRLVDRDLQAEEIYYYRLYLQHGGNFYSTKYHWATEAVATGAYDFSGRLYGQLPAVHQYYDEPEAGKKDRGQLRRYLSLAGAALDQDRSLAEVLRRRHDANRVYTKALPKLAKMIGWRPDVTSDAILLRKDIIDAPDIYRTVGTVANLRTVVNRVTGWDCKIKEFVHNIFLTNAVEHIYRWEIWAQHHDGVGWSTPQALTTTDGMDGHPQAVIDNGATAWLFWHADRGGDRGLWRQPLDSGSPVPKAVILRRAEERAVTKAIDEYPATVADGDRLWLFWASNYNGRWEIWGSWSRSALPFSTGPDSSETTQSKPLNLSDHPADDRRPAVIRDGAGTLWLFWQSNRRGPTDIWCRTFDGLVWGLPERLTGAGVRHLAPTAAIDDEGRIWLCYCNDQGDRINIHAILYIGGSWSGPFAISTGKHRDEAPTAVFWNGELRLFWHSDRHGRWQLLGQGWEWSEAEEKPLPIEPDPEAISDEVTHDKEPFAMVDGANQLRLLWRSQRRGRAYQSRSIDTGDARMKAELGTFQDRAHYTYDTGKTETNFYARDTVGVFITPDPEKPDLDDRNRRLFNGPLKEFIPINIRPVLFILPVVHKEYVYTYDFPGVDPQRLIGEDYSRVSTRISEEVYSGLSDGYADAIPDWTWLRSWSPTITDHRTVDTTTPSPIDIHFRTWHIGVSEGA